MEFYLEWLKENATILTTLVNIAMLLVWIFYARLLYREYKRQRSPMVFIHQVPDEGLGSDCLVVNLSVESIHILTVAVIAYTEKERFAAKITNYQRLSPDQEMREPGSHQALIDIYAQGPLPPGYFLILSSFKAMLQAVKTGVGNHPNGKVTFEDFMNEVKCIEILVIAMYGHYRSPVGASRTFKIVSDRQGQQISPAMLLTRQMNSYWQRRKVKRWLKEFI